MSRQMCEITGMEWRADTLVQRTRTERQLEHLCRAVNKIDVLKSPVLSMSGLSAREHSSMAPEAVLPSQQSMRIVPLRARET